MRREDVELRLRARVADRKAHREPVELGFRQGIGALVLDRVLRGDHHEGRPQLIRDRVHGHLPLLHRLQEGRLCLGAGPVDLIGQDDVGEDGPGPELEVPTLLVEDVHAGDVGWKEVRRELDPSEGAIDGPGDALGQHGLSDARHVLDQEVALRHERGEGQTDLAGLALDDLLDVSLDGLEERREPEPLRRLSCGRHARLPPFARSRSSLPGWPGPPIPE